MSQTDGTELDDVAPVRLEGDAPEALWKRLAEQVAIAGFTLERGDCGIAYGTTDHMTRRVVVRSDVSAAQAAKTLTHELAHVLLHAELDGSCRGVAEVEAESVAYLVCSAAGLATDNYTFPYVAQWASGDALVVRATAERVIATARRVLEAIGITSSAVTEEAA